MSFLLLKGGFPLSDIDFAFLLNYSYYIQCSCLPTFEISIAPLIKMMNIKWHLIGQKCDTVLSRKNLTKTAVNLG